MNSLSVSGKNWVLKNYSEEKSNFLKEIFLPGMLFLFSEPVLLISHNL